MVIPVNEYWEQIQGNELDELNPYQQELLIGLVHAQRPLNTLQAMEKAGVSWNTAKKHLQKLEDKGLICSEDNGDRTRWQPKENTVPDSLRKQLDVLIGQEIIRKEIALSDDGNQKFARIPKDIERFLSLEDVSNVEIVASSFVCDEEFKLTIENIEHKTTGETR